MKSNSAPPYNWTCSKYGDFSHFNIHNPSLCSHHKIWDCHSKAWYYLRMSLAQVQWAHKECKLYPFLYSASNKGQLAACVSKILFPWETQIYKSNPDDNWTAVLGCVTNLLEGKHSWNWHLYLWDEWETGGGNDHWTWGCQHTGDYIQ